MKKLIRLSLLACFLTFYSCQKEEMFPMEENITMKNGSGVTLGQRLENAYSTANMRRAYNELRSSGELNTGVNIQTTHLYVKFTPVDSAQINTLVEDSTIILFNHPLDYEIEGEGEYASGKETCEFYTVVPLGYRTNVAPCVLLDSCCLPGDNPSPAMSKVEKKALEMTGNMDSDVALANTRAAQIPEGHIYVYNTERGQYEGVKKVKVVTWKLVNVRSTYTDENGYYQMNGSYLCKPNYEIRYRNQTGFVVWGNRAFFAPAALYLGKQVKTGFNQYISTNSVGWYWSTINNAAYSYREQLCPQNGVTKPYSNLRIWFINNDNIRWYGSAPMIRHVALSSEAMNWLADAFDLDVACGIALTEVVVLLGITMPDIFIIKRESEDTEETSRTVFHELAHASHCTKVGASYWASYIGQIVLNQGYGDSATNNNGVIGVGEMWGYYFDKICIEQYMGIQGEEVNHRGTWFRPQILVGLDNEITGVTPAMIFSHYTPSIRSHADLKQSLKSYYSSIFNLGACLQVDEIFESNGF